MIVYLDASVVVALLTADPCTQRAETFFELHEPTPIVSDFAAAEFVSAVSRRVRTGDLLRADATTALVDLDRWMQRFPSRILTTSADIAAADAILRRLDLPLLTPDALNIAICLRSGALLATFGARMRTCASALGLALAPA